MCIETISWRVCGHHSASWTFCENAGWGSLLVRERPGHKQQSDQEKLPDHTIENDNNIPSFHGDLCLLPGNSSNNSPASTSSSPSSSLASSSSSPKSFGDCSTSPSSPASCSTSNQDIDLDTPPLSPLLFNTTPSKTLPPTSPRTPPPSASPTTASPNPSPKLAPDRVKYILNQQRQSHLRRVLKEVLCPQIEQVEDFSLYHAVCVYADEVHCAYHANGRQWKCCQCKQGPNRTKTCYRQTYLSWVYGVDTEDEDWQKGRMMEECLHKVCWACEPCELPRIPVFDPDIMDWA